MYTMGRVIHVPNVQLELSPLISLSPETVLNKVIIPLTVFTVVPHLSLRWLALFLVGMVHSGWLFSLRKRIFRNVWQSIKWVSKMVGFRNPHLFLRWGFWRFLNNSIFDYRFYRFGWSGFGQDWSGDRFLTRFQATALTNLPKEISTFFI